MRAHWGKAWLTAAYLVVMVMAVPLPGQAAVSYTWQNSSGRLPISLVATQSSLEAQMLGEESSPPPSPGSAFLQKTNPSMHLNQDSASIKLPYNVEMNISVLYKREPAPEPKSIGDSPLLMKYAMDYRLFPNLQVGLSSYLYRPSEDILALPRPRANRLGFGPELKYNLGRWSFLLKSQMESGNREHPEGVQNWFRVWYAF